LPEIQNTTKMKRILALAILATIAVFSLNGQDRYVIAYVISWQERMPDPTYLTHINYAFGHVNDNFDGVRLDNPDRLRKIVRLKKKKPGLKVLLSIGGWGSGRFSEMAGDDNLRKSFTLDCRRICRKYHLDGIDIDWEYPGSDAAKISCSDKDTDNYTLLMRDLREALGPDKILSQATCGSARYIDFKAVDPYVNYTNVMSYDLGWAPYLDTPLYWSENVDPNSLPVDDCIKAHLDAGVPADKLVMGLKFYGHAEKGFKRPSDIAKAHVIDGYSYNWDKKAQVPYLTNDQTGTFAFGYEDEKSLRIKCRYIISTGLRGAMYWHYGSDNADQDMLRTIYGTLRP